MGENARKKENDIQKPYITKGAEPPTRKRHDEPDMRIRVQREEQTRIARVEELRAQVNAGTYKVDSKAIAQKMLRSPETMKLLGLGKEDLLAHKDEE